MRFSDYDQQINRPTKSEFTTTYFYKNGQVVATVRPGEKPYAMPANALRETVVNEEAYKIACLEYQKHSARIREMFTVDLLQDFGLPDDSFTRRLVELAYEEGHSSGYGNVYSCFLPLSELADLAKEVYCK